MRGERSWGGSFASIFAYTLSAFADRASGRSRDLYLLEQTPRKQLCLAACDSDRRESSRAGQIGPA